MEELLSFQVYSIEKNENLNFLADKAWIRNNRIYFRILENLSMDEDDLKKEREPNIYSINLNEIYSIRCRIYF
ncbi:MAG: hypothetical protein EU539_03905 [Promethearchaeota archaeon]|nr:MAG: hypothetical protein EU539_03905 [Candidatus Lokiarchaeota archaeon]